MNCKHNWIRTNLVTTEDMCDTFRCSKCGAWGKRFGLDDDIMLVDTSKKITGRDGIGFRTGRPKSTKTKIKEAKEWSWQQYQERLKNEKDNQLD